MMTIRDYLEKNSASTIDTLATLTDELKQWVGEMEELPTRESLLGMLLKASESIANTQKEGFDECIKLIDQCDRSLLNHKLPPHMRC